MKYYCGPHDKRIPILLSKRSTRGLLDWSRRIGSALANALERLHIPEANGFVLATRR